MIKRTIDEVEEKVLELWESANTLKHKEINSR